MIGSWLGIASIFVIVWWLTLFMVLPFGAAPPDEVEPGMAPSAPAKPRIAVKLAVTTVLAGIITAGIVWLIGSGLIQLRPTGQDGANIAPRWSQTLVSADRRQTTSIR